jgi:hypothetical protein
MRDIAGGVTEEFTRAISTGVILLGRVPSRLSAKPNSSVADPFFCSHEPDAKSGSRAGKGMDKAGSCHREAGASDKAGAGYSREAMVSESCFVSGLRTDNRMIRVTEAAIPNA